MMSVKQFSLLGLKPKRISILVIFFATALLLNVGYEHMVTNTLNSSAPGDLHRKNVLFLITDDMRTQLGCYSGPESVFDTVKMHTPNLDKLAAKSLLLKRAYVQYTLCCPSRASMMTGRRPDTTGVVGNDLYWRDLGHNFTTLPQYFKDQGYHSTGIAKIFHKFKDNPSWSAYKKFGNPEKKVIDFKKGATWLSYTKEQNSENPLFDIMATREAMAQLEELAPKARTGEQPFFMALGFNKPHVPFVAPEEYFELYPLESGKRYLHREEWQAPRVRSGAGMLNVTEINGELTMIDVVLREHRRAYFACISFVDDLVGQALDALDKLGLADSTIVSFVADHGYHLGENGQFGKNLLTEVSSHVPMMLHIPGVTDDGITSNSIVEAIDLFPTIAEAAGLEVPPSCPGNSENISACVQGKSLLPLIEHPNKHIKEAAFTQLKISDDNYRGYSMRTNRYRYIEYVRIEQTGDSLTVYRDPKRITSELYDHTDDIEETQNRTADAKYADSKIILRRNLHNFIKESLGVNVLKPDDR